MNTVLKIVALLLHYAVCIAREDKEPRGPHIIVEPKDTIFNADSNLPSVSIECEADGYPRPTYKWKKNDVDVNILADNRLTLMEGKLTIAEPRQSDAGSFQCFASNDYGVVLSQIATLSFGFVDPFPRQGQSPKVATEGNGFMLSCNAPDAYPGLSFYWVKDIEFNFVRESERLMIASNGNMYFAKVDQGDQGDYSCIVKNILDAASGAGQDGRISPQISVSVLTNNFAGFQSPKVSHAVQDQTVLEGDNVRLECFFRGNPVPRLSWERVAPFGQAIPSSASFDNQNQVLILRNIQEEDGGNYQCIAENSPDNQNSRPTYSRSTGTIDVRVPPKWIKQLEDLEADIRGSATFECEATGTEPITYKWYRNGEQFTTRTRHSFSNNFKRLTINSLQDADSAMYQCKAANTLLDKERAIYSTGQLTVLAIAPSFADTPLLQNQPAARNGNITIECNPEAAPKPDFTWLHNNRPISITNGGHYTILDNGHLFIQNVQDSDGGKYTCIARNYIGEDQSEGRLVIRDGTVITQWPLAMSIEVGDDATLKCRATADPVLDLTYIWLLDGVQIDVLDDSHYARLRDGNLEIIDAELRQSGVYTCTAHTTIDEVSKSAEVIIKGAPGPPAGVRASDITTNSCQLRWSEGFSNNDPIKTYTVQSRTKEEPEWIIEREGIPDLSASLNSLSPWSNYQFRVSAVNSYGRGEPSLPSPEYSTHEDKPYHEPRNVGGGGGKTGDLRITWDPLSRQDQNAPGLGYYVYWKKANSREEYSKGVVNDEAVGVYTVKGVPTYVQYDVRVGVFNAKGDGPNSTISTIYSHESAPSEAPDNVEAEATSGSTIKVTWDSISTNNLKGKLRGYKLKYWSSDDSEATASTVSTPGVTTRYEIQNLDYSTVYNIKVLAYSGGGNGPASDNVVRVTTLKSAPQDAPENVKAAVSSWSSILVTWDKITSYNDEEEPLEGYKILYYLDGRFERDATKVDIKGADTIKGTISGLQPGATYLLQVQGYSEGGDGVTSDPIKIPLYGSQRQIGAAPSMHCVSLSLLAFSLLLHTIRNLC
ncbi:contactin-like protein precursor [Saccoglossus kowalevskii]|uniref:Axonin n=1 Tax=Saccoglossus kowalevskii TaxID=10224 RepID=D1LWW8_SACKO|nr:contactin-like protein precursor [Saccoglossus kowalevskii]XP_006825503.1 PREDICTED: contactin-like protein isoform X1 [Saccoglossus kowalevskii]XP_006825504.1 PREDICTED: contactin-like protein isoform X2 [Saccoglossus kowalevskii]ACY92474.1 axonin [Saccoglossus kowalevskii]